MKLHAADASHAVPRPSVRRAGVRQAGVLLAATTLPVMGVISLVPVVPALMRHFAAVPSATYLVPVMLVAPGLCIALLSPLMGIIADRIGRRRMLLAALALYAVFGLMPLLLERLQWIIASRFGLGVAEAVIMTVTTTLTGDYFREDERKKWIGAQTALGSLTATVLFLSGGALGKLGWRGPFYLYAFAIPVFAAAVIYLFEPTASAFRQEHPEAPKTAFPWRAIAGICLVSTLCSIAFYAAPLQLGLRLAGLGITDTGTIGLIAGLSSLGFPLGALLFRRFGHHRVPVMLAAILGTIGIGLSGIGFATGMIGVSVAMAVHQVASGALMPCLITWCLSRLDFAHRGQGAGLWTSAFFLGQFVSPLIMAAIADNGRGSATAFLMIGAAYLGAGLITAFSGRQREV